MTISKPNPFKAAEVKTQLCNTGGNGRIDSGKCYWLNEEER
jgi:hypothetical protein